MGKKIRTTIYLDEEISEKAKDLGLNISKVCENSLIQAIKAMEGVYGKKEPKIHPISHLKMEDGGPGRDRTCDHRHVKAVSYH